MKKVQYYFSISLFMAFLAHPSIGFSSHQKSNSNSDYAEHKNSKSAENDDDEYDVLDIDEVDDSDIFAIPYDDSELEDEEEINQAEKKEVFKIPSPR